MYQLVLSGNRIVAYAPITEGEMFLNWISAMASSGEKVNGYGTEISTNDPYGDNIEITQKYIDSSAPVFSYRNGFFCIYSDSLEAGKQYTLSFDYTIKANPLSVSDIKIMPSGASPMYAGACATVAAGSFSCDFTFSNSEKQYIEIRNSGLSMTIKNIKITYTSTETEGDGSFISMGGTVINNKTGKVYQNATVAECEGIPCDIDKVGYEYHAGEFIPCAPYGKTDKGGNVLVACEECSTPRDSGIKTNHILTMQDMEYARFASAYNGQQDIAYGNGMCYAVCDYCNHQYSENGFLWSYPNEGIATRAHKVALGNGKIVICTVGQVLQSDDNGATFTTPLYVDTYYGVAYGNGVFVAICQRSGDNSNLTILKFTDLNGEIETSTIGLDGINYRLTFDGSQFHIMREYGNSANRTTYICSSTDGVNWSETQTISKFNLDLQYSNGKNFAYGKDRLVIVGQNNGIDGISTGSVIFIDGTNDYRLDSTNVFRSVAYGNGVFVIVGDNGAAKYSEDGVVWESVEMPESVNYRQIIFAGDKFLAVSNGSGTLAIAYSYNGKGWTTGGLEILTGDGTIVTKKVKALLNAE